MRLLGMVAAVAALALMPCQADVAPPAGQHVTVYGQVAKQGRYVFGQGATVNDALKMAGGTKATAKLKHFKVARKFSTGKGVTIYVPFEKAGTFLLKPGDVIIVDEKLESF